MIYRDKYSLRSNDSNKYLWSLITIAFRRLKELGILDESVTFAQAKQDILDDLILEFLDVSLFDVDEGGVPIHPITSILSAKDMANFISRIEVYLTSNGVSLEQYD